MKIFCSLLLSTVVQFFLWQAAEAQPLTKVRIGYPSISSRQAQLWIAKDEGLFRKYGLDVELIFLRGGQVAVQALASGDPPLVTVGNVILANLQGYDNVLVASVDMAAPQFPQARSARPEQFVDLSFLQELEAEGFFSEMERRYH